MTDFSRVDDASPGTQRILLDVTGMTCGMCSSRIAKRLNKVDGVRASVDLASGIAIIDAGPGISSADLCLVVEKAGYRATEHVGIVTEGLDPSRHRVRSPFRQLVDMVVMLFSWFGIRRR
ncbi:heavy-metal-associated domain-containing protein [Mycolicibacterium helvum]|uniref:heavy-metal-associated domain-containing protein n=1 Tax=Mycolicibacterium helvum TaxID=1534349 RepID=UPI001FECA56E|nr:heavy metal-associated domain-containing protein [Mycolicibacterium helvum]